MPRSSFLIFDLDGTISDPLLGIGRSLNFALQAHGFPEITDDEIAKFIGPPLDRTFREIVPDCDDTLVSTLVARYRERYAEAGFTENELYDGIPEVLGELADAGARLGVCTSKRSDFAEMILERFGLLDRFEFVDGGDVGIAKTQQLAGLLEKGVIDTDSTMIGDRHVDIEAARANGLRSVGVLWGYGSLTELSEAGADRILPHVSELSALADDSVS